MGSERPKAQRGRIPQPDERCTDLPVSTAHPLKTFQIRSRLENDQRGWLDRDFDFVPMFHLLLFARPKSVVDVNGRFFGGDL
jgi:hypothetical protein